mmetsp:Transcript_7356/g.5622  ORF Transcript_7356/g.5622 Transcript_7356/m.5622 type:complete len:109 (+) Transcript_7356:93-419(+)
MEGSEAERLKKDQVAKIVEYNNSFWIFHESYFDSSAGDEGMERCPEQRIWKIARYCRSKNKQTEGHRLVKGDILKMGRLRFKVRDIVSDGYKKLEKKLQEKANNIRTI